MRARACWATPRPCRLGRVAVDAYAYRAPKSRCMSGGGGIASRGRASFSVLWARPRAAYRIIVVPFAKCVLYHRSVSRVVKA